MAMSSFAGVSFQVVGRNGRFPAPVRDADKAWRWRGEVLFASRSARNSLADKLSDVTVKAPIGTVLPNLHIDGGYGSGALSLPVQAGTLGALTAVLTGFSDSGADGRLANVHWATVEFTISGDPTV